MDSFQYVFPAIRGVQAGREYYISMCPLRLIPKIFLFDEEELVPELRAQRMLNRARIPEMSRYLVENAENYVLSALTASVDADIEFDPQGSGAEGAHIGLLRIPMSGRFIINDGQHRRAAIESALKERPSLGDETIAVVFFLDTGLKRCQQMFADLNRYAIRPAHSIGILYDHRDDRAELARQVVAKSPVFRNVVETERSTLALRSRRLYTFSAIYSACNALLNEIDLDSRDEGVDLAIDFWGALDEVIPEWKAVRRGRMTASDVRQDLIHSHGVVLQALGRAGNGLLRNGREGWTAPLSQIAGLDWSRNSPEWNGRAIVNGRLSKATTNVILTSNRLKMHLGLTLMPEEQRIEGTFERGDYEQH